MTAYWASLARRAATLTVVSGAPKHAGPKPLPCVSAEEQGYAAYKAGQRELSCHEKIGRPSRAAQADIAGFNAGMQRASREDVA